MSLAEVRKLPKRDELEEELAGLRRKSRGWFEEMSEYEARYKAAKPAKRGKRSGGGGGGTCGGWLGNGRQREGF